jgi:hypothetical protein
VPQRTLPATILAFSLSISALPIAVLSVPITAAAQWPRYTSKKAPRKADGSVDLSAPAPRTPQGKPDFSGLWEQYAEVDMPKYLLNLAADLKPDDLQMEPWAVALMRERQANNSVDHPGGRCLPSGVPEKDAVPAPFKFIQTDDLIAILYESRTIYRQILMDGRPLPTNAEPTWQGYSVGHWDGDALVVDTRGFHENGWLDMAGHPASDQLHVVERFTRPTYGSMNIDITIDDAKTYKKPWTVHQRAHIMPSDELMEHICEENNRDAAHLVGK